MLHPLSNSYVLSVAKLTKKYLASSFTSAYTGWQN